MDYANAFNIGSIQLEPRLQEYVRRKNFNEENDIEPPISEEKEFCITPHDLKIIKKFKQGKKMVYTELRLAKDPHFVKPDMGSFNEFHNDDAFKKDPRYQRIRNKQQSHRDAQKKIRNLDNMDKGYTIFHQSNPYDLKPKKFVQKISKPYDDHDDHDAHGAHSALSTGDCNSDKSFNESIMMDSRDIILSRSKKTTHIPQSSMRHTHSYRKSNRDDYCYSPNDTRGKENTYHHPPNINYRQRLTNTKVSGTMEHSRELKDIIGNIDIYNKHLNGTYDYLNQSEYGDEYGDDSGVSAPNTRTKTKRDTPSSYQSIPFGYGNGLPDISVEDSMRGNIRDSSKKSIGFKNTFEHNFDYISGDISDPNNTVQMYPQSTRGQNKEISRPESRSARYDHMIRTINL